MADTTTGTASSVSLRMTGWLKNYWGATIVLAAVVCLIVTGLVGIDFGFHWDEPTQFRLVHDAIAKHTLLPHWYHYPSATFLLSLFAVLPHAYTAMHRPTGLSGRDFYIQTRSVFLVATALGGLWLYLALRRRAGEVGAAFGAATYLLSFQLAYHARWIAPDAISATTAALFLWLFLVAWDAPDSSRRLLLPAVAAGLATATKYQGAVLMVPVVMLLLRRWRAEPAKFARARTFAEAIGGFVVTFLVITPGAVLQHSTFVADIRAENHHYRTTHVTLDGGARPYDVTNHVSYLWKLVKYVVLSLPSHSIFASAIVIALAVLGVATLGRREPWLTVAVVLPGAIVALYFSSLNVFIVRNFLILLPFVAFWAGMGVGRLAEQARTRASFSLVAVLLGALLVYNGAWLVHAAQTIADESTATLVKASDTYMRDRSGKTFVLSGPMELRFHGVGVALPKNVHTRGPADYLVVLSSQIEGDKIPLREWPATSRDTYRVVGPLEVDVDFYPTWAGADRVLFLPVAQATRFGLTRPELQISP